MYVGGNPVPLMPVTGIANYLPVGGTGPIDSLGNVGQFTGATVTADFAAASLSVNINLSANGVAYVANGSGTYAPNGVIPETRFTTVTCAPACGASPASGAYTGAFVGTNATGLGLVYHVTNPNITAPNIGRDIVGAQGFIRQ